MVAAHVLHRALTGRAELRLRRVLGRRGTTALPNAPEISGAFFGFGDGPRVSPANQITKWDSNVGSGTS